MNPIHFDYASWLATYNEAYKTHYEPIKLVQLSAHAAKKRQGWLREIEAVSYKSPQDLVTHQGKLVPRQHWRQVTLKQLNDAAAWKLAGTYGRQLARKPQATQALTRWSLTWQKNKTGAAYTQCSLLALAQSGALPKLIADYESILASLSEETVLAAHAEHAKALRGAIVAAIDAGKKHQAQLIETMLQRLSRFQATGFTDAEPIGSSVETVLTLGVKAPIGTPAKGEPLTTDSLQAFYGYISQYGDADAQLRLKSLGWTEGALELTWQTRPDGQSFFVPSIFAGKVPGELSFWDKILPNWCKGAWARWQLFENQSATLVKLQAQQQKIEQFDWSIEDPDRLAAFTRLCDEQEKLLQSSIEHLNQPPYNALSSLWQSGTVKLINVWTLHLKLLNSNVQAQRFTQLEKAVSKLVERASQGALLEIEKQQHGESLLALVNQYLDHQKASSGTINHQSLQQVAYQLSQLMSNKLDEHPVKWFPCVTLHAMSGSSTSMQAAATKELKKTRAGELRDQLKSVIRTLTQGERLPLQCLEVLENFKGELLNESQALAQFRQEMVEELDNLRNQALELIVLPPYEKSSAKAVEQRAERLLTLFKLFVGLGMGTAVQSLQAKLPDYFVHHAEQLLDVQVQKRLDNTPDMASLMAEYAPGYDSVEQVIHELADDTCYNELTLAQWSVTSQILPLFGRKFRRTAWQAPAPKTFLSV